jgi:hypothetical protein
VHELQEHMHGVKNKLDSIIANLKVSLCLLYSTLVLAPASDTC